MMTPYLEEQLHLLLVIIRHGKACALKSKDPQQVDHWDHVYAEVQFLRANLRKHPAHRLPHNTGD